MGGVYDTEGSYLKKELSYEDSKQANVVGVEKSFHWKMMLTRYTVTSFHKVWEHFTWTRGSGESSGYSKALKPEDAPLPGSVPPRRSALTPFNQAVEWVPD